MSATHLLDSMTLNPVCGAFRSSGPGSQDILVVECEDCKNIYARSGAVSTGLRFNKRKLPVHLISPFVALALGKQLQFGIDKGYPSRNWEKGLSWMETIASLERHLLNFKMGAEFDTEKNPVTGELLPELYGVICNAMFLLHFYETKTGTDDRPPYATTHGIKPHPYMPTDPYRGCGECGYGPGAIQHNASVAK